MSISAVAAPPPGGPVQPRYLLPALRRDQHTRLAHLLQQHDRPDSTPEEKRIVVEDLVREITALWQTDELRRRKPTPLDGAFCTWLT